jgi:hypothetical protein
MLRLPFTIFLCYSLSGCEKTYPRKSVSSDALHVDIVLKEVKTRENYYVLYGNLDFNSKTKIKEVDLTCLSLTTQGQKSDGIYVDSIASFQAQHYHARNKKTLNVDVYWVFKSKINEQLLDQSQIKLLSKDGSNIKNIEQCMTFTDEKPAAVTKSEKM